MKTKEKEVWRDIPNYEQYYQVSNMGRVRSVDRTVVDSMGRKYYFKGRNLKFNKKQEYNKVTLSKDGKKRGYNVSQLVAMTYLNHTPDGHQLVIDHINGDKLNDSVENLQIVTSRENISSCHRNDRNILSSNFVGVNYHKQTDNWRAQIFFNKKRIYLGLYPTEIEASKAYQKFKKDNNIK